MIRSFRSLVFPGLSHIALILLGISCLILSCSREYKMNVDEIFAYDVAPPLPIDENGKISPQLLELLDILDVKHDGTLKNILDLTQKAWLRPAGKERWEIEDIFDAKRSIVMPLLDKMGFVRALKPSKQHYDYALLQGAMMQRMRARLVYLIVQWNAGVRFDKIVVLTGARERNNEMENEEVFTGKISPDLPIRTDWKWDGVIPATENDLIKLIFEQTEFPPDLAKVPVEFVATPMIPTANGGFRRPNSGDVVEEWIKRNPKPGSCLAFSNQPFAVFQHAAIRAVLPDAFEVETVGSLANLEKASVAVYLDNVARYIYATYQCVERKKALKNAVFIK